MTNRTSIYLGLIICGAVIADFVLNDGQASLFLARKFVDLLDWVAFWR